MFKITASESFVLTLRTRARGEEGDQGGVGGVGEGGS